MKKTAILLLALCLALCFCACGTTTAEPSPETGTTVSGLSDAESEMPDSTESWLYGTWIHDEYDGRGDSLDGTTLPKELYFSDKQVQMVRNGSEEPVNGTFSIQQDGNETGVVCTFEDETIYLQRNGNMLFFDENEENLFLVYFFGGDTPQAESGGDPITAQQAESIARSYVSGSEGKRALLKKANADSMEYFEITSVSTSGSGTFRVTVKGNFFGHDEYGVLKDHYQFTCTIPVKESDGRILTGSISVSVGAA